MQSLTPAELQARLDAGDVPQLLDVREPEELAICQLPGVVPIPLGELLARFDELESDRPVVCICHHGIRSARAAGFLISRGFTQVINLTGGMDRWSAEVDGSVPRY